MAAASLFSYSAGRVAKFYFIIIIIILNLIF